MSSYSMVAFFTCTKSMLYPLFNQPSAIIIIIFFFSFKFYSVQSSANKYKMIIIHLCTITKSQIITFLHLSRNNMNAFFRIAI